MRDAHTRREFIRHGIGAAGSLLVTGRLGATAGAPDTRTFVPNAPPRRKLGRTGVEVSIIGMGMAPLGIAGYSRGEFRSTVETAIAEGINYFDLQPDYGQAELYFGPLLRRYGERLFVVTKTSEQTRDGVLRSVGASLARLQISRLDAVLLNNVGLFDMDRLFTSDGALAGLKELRRRGQVRFLGLSGHMGVENISRVMQSSEFDIVMAPFNFVDAHLYTFERDILPIAEKHGCGVLAMKALGGAVGLKYDNREQQAKLRGSDYSVALRYTLALPGICSVVVGCKDASEVRMAARAGREYRPLDNAELVQLRARGEQLAAQWGRHYPET